MSPQDTTAMTDLSDVGSSQMALKNFEVENNVIEIGEELFAYDKNQQQAILKERPWNTDPQYFKEAKISAKALIKMITHTRSGGNIEVMGIMIGKIIGNSMVVIDAFALPVEGTETRVNAQAEGNEYMIQYLDQIQEVMRSENAIGWYHSHPGYGCWLSGIDVSTQKLNQQFQEPFLAVVIDPIRSISAGKVDIGAFRTYPSGYTPYGKQLSDFQAVPVDKIEDFGVHANEYYPLEVTFFKSMLDTKLIDNLWSKYWVNTLSQSTLFSNRAFFSSQIKDINQKISLAENKRTGGCCSAIDHYYPTESSSMEDAPLTKNSQTPLKFTSEFSKVASEGSKVTNEASHAMMTDLLKLALFGLPSRSD